MSKININHLEYLEAILSAGNITRAAETVGIRQSTLSFALSKMREEFNDVLFIKTKSGMEPTRKAVEIIKKTRELQSIISNKGIIDRSEDYHLISYDFKILVSDGISKLFVGPLINSLNQNFPNITIILLNGDQRNIGNYLDDGTMDLAISFFGDLPCSIRKIFLYQQKLVAVARRQHPQLQGAFSIDDIQRLQHIAWRSPSTPRPLMESMLEKKLLEFHIKRKIALVVPTLTLVPEFVAQTDLISIIPERQAAAAQATQDIDLWELPFALSSVDISMVWHERNHLDIAHRWIRNEIFRITEALRQP